MGWNLGTDRAERRQERRETRRAKRKERKANKGKGERSNDKYLGGSKEQERLLYDEARQGKIEAVDREKGTAKKLDAERESTSKAAKRAAAEYSTNQADTRNQLAAQSQGIENMGLAARTAQDQLVGAQSMRSSALNSTSLPPAAQAAIDANARNAQAQLSANLGLANRSMMGLAAGQGEGGALAMQQAMAQAGQGGYDAMVQSQLLQNQQAADIRAAERSNMLQTANLNAGDQGTQAQLTYGAAQNQQAAQAQLAQQQQAQQQLASQRQLGLSSQAGQLASAQEQADLENQGQNMQYQSGLLTAKYGAQEKRTEGRGRSVLRRIFTPLDILGN